MQRLKPPHGSQKRIGRCSQMSRPLKPPACKNLPLPELHNAPKHIFELTDNNITEPDIDSVRNIWNPSADPDKQAEPKAREIVEHLCRYGGGTGISDPGHGGYHDIVRMHAAEGVAVLVECCCREIWVNFVEERLDGRLFEGQRAN
jgi:hypothetical protein